ncbi:hypothetical protein [Mycoplasmopsis gallinacea]|uniref:Lipoprotein n=1 Tax=Mycoplasmopsis gallinacea TaxID=29556 RepID=A0A6H0V176_9BACT|nr:hypothetical protein [Mycoplasmopsis gallinacea]QIW61952.1 hypothetical protein GOQ20_00490 [Mycoplasmopsis gallinacea]
MKKIIFSLGVLTSFASIGSVISCNDTNKPVNDQPFTYVDKHDIKISNYSKLSSLPETKRNLVNKVKETFESYANFLNVNLDKNQADGRFASYKKYKKLIWSSQNSVRATLLKIINKLNPQNPEQGKELLKAKIEHFYQHLRLYDDIFYLIEDFDSVFYEDLENKYQNLNKLKKYLEDTLDSKSQIENQSSEVYLTAVLEQIEKELNNKFFDNQKFNNASEETHEHNENNHDHNHDHVHDDGGNGHGHSHALANLMNLVNNLLKQFSETNIDQENSDESIKVKLTQLAAEQNVDLTNEINAFVNALKQFKAEYNQNNIKNNYINVLKNEVENLKAKIDSVKQLVNA